ncbi:DUF3253 domain-containing protein [Aquiflexum lacus]|uniref:DUF3253 domain-containing protein n=1 Tax=Aquiflexum lacus TaxID=2483805 RepID=UPI0018960A81|nr:DUF3253 domain-containing protein [Aquiflexum lacus]
MLEKHLYIEPNILEIAILEMCRLKKEDSFSPTDVVKWLYPQHWIYFISEAEEAMMKLHRSGKIIVLENNEPDIPTKMPELSFRIKAKPKTS